MERHKVVLEEGEEFCLKCQFSPENRIHTDYKEYCRKLIPIEAHGTVYFREDGYLMGYPMLLGGGFDREGIMQIEESPMSFKLIHNRVKRELGLRKDKNFIKYY